MFGALAAIEPPSACAHVLEHVLPFELDVIYARITYWAGNAHGYTDALGGLLRRCRRRARMARLDADRQMWIERGARVGLTAASHFIEIKVSPLSLPHFYLLSHMMINGALVALLNRRRKVRREFKEKGRVMQ